MRDGPVPGTSCLCWWPKSIASSNSDRGAHTASSNSDGGAHTASSNSDCGAHTGAHTCTCPKLLQVGKRLWRKLCKWLVQPGPVQLQWLRWDLVRPDSPERCEAPQGVSAKFRGVARFVANLAQ